MRNLITFLLIAATFAGSTLRAATLPSAANIYFQTSGRERAATIGDWYTTKTSASTDRIHRFVIEVTQAMITANGGSVTVSVLDAESNGALDEVTGTPDPTRFQLRAENGVTVLQTRTLPSGTADGTTATFTITVAGTYQITSESGAFPISGDATVGLNDDDNTFKIFIPGVPNFLGFSQSTLTHVNAGTLSPTFYFVVPPGTASLFLRNFDLDGGGTISYRRPSGSPIAGTASGNGLWNGPSPTLNTGGDTIAGLSQFADAGIWQYTITGFTTNNQVAIEANTGTGIRLPLTDVQPTSAGNFTIVANTTLTTAIGASVDHPFTVTNLASTNDLIQFTTASTAANYTVQLLDSGGTPLTDADGNGQLDTGLMTGGEVKNFILRVTPTAGATVTDVTRINAVSFLDQKVDPVNNTTLFVDKTTQLGGTLSGNVFEDVNYGGGAGRTKAAASGINRPGARVELYNSSGAFVSFTTTDASGNYTFSGVTSGNYSLRVVNSSVTSSRTGYVASLLPVQTFRTNASTGTAVAATDRVGGETPNLADAGNGSTTLAALTTAGTTAQSITAVSVSTANITGLDFGFNFDTVVNVNGTGQGSLRQFLTNANALSNTGLAQSGLVAGKDNAVFMISNGTAAAGLRVANNYFTTGIATIAPASALPTVTDPVVIDATKQPGWTTTPIVELNGTGAGLGTSGLSITAGSSVVRGLVINRFTGSGLALATGGSNVIAGNYLGTNAAGTAASANTLAGVTITSGNGNTIGGNTAGEPNIIAFNGAKGVNVLAGTGHAILRNSIYGNTGLGIDLGNNGISANDGTVSGLLANNGNDYPIFTTSTLVGTTLTLAGYVGSAPGQATFANATVQVFKANNSPADQNGETIVADGLSVAHGEGQTFLGTLTADASGNFSGTLTVSGLVVGDFITATATDPANNTSEFSSNSLVTNPGSISGNVFEDVNYGGGAGRTKAASSGVSRPAARVELFDNAGNFVSATTTDPSGNYTFASLAAANYTVRVVSSTVTSSRSGYVPGLLPVQTFRTNASTGTAVAATDRVGGETPNLADAGNGSTTLTALTTATTTAQSVTTVTLGTTAVTGVDFGFNFDTVVNVNGTGQGSLRQFLTNANALSNTGLAQSGLVAGRDNAVFMISNGTAAAGLRVANNYFTAGIATIAPTSALPTVTDPVVIDATKQPGWTATPIVELTGTGAGGGVSGLSISAGSSVVRGLIVNSFLSSGIALSGAGGNVIQGNYLGTNAAGTASSQNDQQGILISGSPNNLIGGTTAGERNVISGNRLRGIFITGAGATGNTISGNFVGLNAAGTSAVPNIIGIYISDAGSNTVGGTAAGAGNVISGATQIGLYFVGAGATGNIAQGNIIGLDAAGTAPVPNGTRGVEFVTGASNNTIGGAVAGAPNIIAANAGGGVRVITGTGNRIQRNSIYGNTNTGIDLGLDNVTGNDGAIASAPNNGMDYPVFTAASVSGGTLSVTGYVGSAPGQSAFANAVIEIFKADNAPADQNGEIILGDAKSVAHGEGRTFLGEIIADGSGNFSASFAVSGLSTGDIITATATNAGNDTSEFGANFVVTVPGVAVSGTVYSDANHNAQIDGSESGTGLTLYAKLIPNATPAGPASQAVAVNPATGAYSFSGVAAGTYILVIDDNNTLVDVTPTIPAGWIGTERPDQTRSGVAVTTVPLPNQNFGLFNGSKITGTVFADTGLSGGTANDGVKNGAETGIANVVLRLTDNSGASTLDQTVTNSGGLYVLWAPAPSATVKVVEVNPASHVSTGASVGTSGGTYSRATDTITFAHTPGTSYTGLDFGDVPDVVFTTDGQQAGQPGTTVVYSHTFTAGSAGSVEFSSVSGPNPTTVTNWSHVIHRDTNGNGQLDAGEPVISGPIVVAAGEIISILVKEYIPADAPFNAQDQIIVTAAFTYTNAAPALAPNLTRTNLTTVGEPATAGLALLKSVDKGSALPGETLTYTITYSNNSPDAVRDVVIFDTTPAFSTFVSASNGPLPASLTGVTIVNPAVGADGAVRWTFTGTLAPGSTGTVTFVVKIAD